MDVVDDDDQRLRLGDFLEQLSEAPGDLVRRCGADADNRVDAAASSESSPSPHGRPHIADLLDYLLQRQ